MRTGHEYRKKTATGRENQVRMLNSFPTPYSMHDCARDMHCRVKFHSFVKVTFSFTHMPFLKSFNGLKDIGYSRNIHHVLRMYGPTSLDRHAHCAVISTFHSGFEHYQYYLCRLLTLMSCMDVSFLGALLPSWVKHLAGIPNHSDEPYMQALLISPLFANENTSLHASLNILDHSAAMHEPDIIELPSPPEQQPTIYELMVHEVDVNGYLGHTTEHYQFCLP